MVLSCTLKNLSFWPNSLLVVISGNVEVIILPLKNGEKLIFRRLLIVTVCEKHILFSYSSLYCSLLLITLHFFMFQSSKKGRNSLSVTSSRMADTELDLWNLINKELKKENIIDTNQHGFRKMNHVKVTISFLMRLNIWLIKIIVFM